MVSCKWTLGLYKEQGMVGEKNQVAISYLATWHFRNWSFYRIAEVQNIENAINYVIFNVILSR